MVDALNELLAQSVGKPLDIASAYFAISGYRLVKEASGTGHATLFPANAENNVACPRLIL